MLSPQRDFTLVLYQDYADPDDAALFNRGMNFCWRGALSAPLQQKFIPEISNADYAN